jgi:hypothetical protein
MSSQVYVPTCIHCGAALKIEEHGSGSKRQDGMTITGPVHKDGCPPPVRFTL